MAGKFESLTSTVNNLAGMMMPGGQNLLGGVQGNQAGAPPPPPLVERKPHRSVSLKTRTVGIHGVGGGDVKMDAMTLGAFAATLGFPRNLVAGKTLSPSEAAALVSGHVSAGKLRGAQVVFDLGGWRGRVDVSTRGSATFHAQMVRFGKSEIPTTVTVTIDKRVTTISKKEKVLLKIKHESLPEIILSPERPTFCPIVVTEQDNKEIHFNFKERQERDTAVVLIRHFVDIAKQKPKKSFLSMFSSKSRSRSKKQK